MSELTMPALGADMRAGRLLEWHIAPGDHVRRGDIVATVDTDKAEIEIETFQALVEPGTKVDAGAPLATISAEDAVAVAASAAPAPATPQVAPTPPLPAPPAVHGRRVSPLARRIAADLGVDVEAVAGTGPRGAVTQADVQRAAGREAPAAPQRPSPAGNGHRAPAGNGHRAPEDRIDSLRRAVGELMARSKREIPHYHLSRAIDMTAALGWLTERNAGRPAPERVLPAALLLRAAVLAAHDVPEINGTWEDGAHRPSPHVDLGVAVSLRAGGVIAPVIQRADELTLDELMAALRAMTGRARRGVLHGADIAGATLTVTSLGEHGADLVHGVIFPPQVGLVGFGAIAPRPWAEGDMVGCRRVVTATLAGDHRVSDGYSGSLYLSTVDRHLQGESVKPLKGLVRVLGLGEHRLGEQRTRDGAHEDLLAVI